MKKKLQHYQNKLGKILTSKLAVQAAVTDHPVLLTVAELGSV